MRHSLHVPIANEPDSVNVRADVAAIALENVSKVYPDGTRAVHELDLDDRGRRAVVFVGPSGCGKTSALRMIAGLEEITDGTIRIGDKVVNELPPKDRDVAMIFQNYALYPHMNAYDNMAFALKMRGIDRRRARPRACATRRACSGSTTCSRRSRGRSPAASGSGSRWAGRSCASRARS